MTALSRVLRYAPPSYLLRVALSELHDALRTIEAQRLQIQEMRDERERWARQLFGEQR